MGNMLLAFLTPIHVVTEVARQWSMTFIRKALDRSGWAVCLNLVSRYLGSGASVCELMVDNEPKLVERARDL